MNAKTSLNSSRRPHVQATFLKRESGRHAYRYFQPRMYVFAQPLRKKSLPGASEDIIAVMYCQGITLQNRYLLM